MARGKAKLASELRQTRPGRMLCELAGDEFTERIYNELINTSDLSYCFEEFLSEGIFQKELTHEQVEQMWEAEGLFNDIRQSTLTEIEKAKRMTFAFESATRICDRWLRKAHLRMFADPLYAEKWHLGEYREEEKWKWSIVPIEEVVPSFFEFLWHKGTSEALELHQLLLHRLRNRMWYFERLESTNRSKKEKWAALREIGESGTEIFLASPDSRPQLIEAIKEELIKKRFLVPQWQRDWDYDRHNFRELMEAKGWNRKDVMADQLGVPKRLIKEILAGAIPIPEDLIEKLDEIARRLNWRPGKGVKKLEGKKEELAKGKAEEKRTRDWSPPYVYQLVKECQSRWDCTQSEVARRSGISPSAISNIIAGRAKVGPAIAAKLDKLAQEINWQPTEE
jgi:plasmid maintenance system antidote protein VapI